MNPKTEPPLEGSSSAILVAVAAAVVAGVISRLLGAPIVADAAWAMAVLVALVPLGVSVARDLLHRETGVDLIALLAMGGSLVLGQFLAGAVIGLMLSGGQSLERYAGARARRELSALIARAPQSVHRYEGQTIASRPVDAVEIGDVLLVKSGEVVPVDGVVRSEGAVLDESALTGESMPVDHGRGEGVKSGSLNVGSPFDIEASSTAEASTYARLIRLVREGQSSKAPFVRLADRYALGFLALTLTVAGLAWIVSGDPVRALAVLVVATPCPLILAAPVAIVAGMSRAAHRGVIVKGGGALETLARVRTLVLDKTGTVTEGSPRLESIQTFDGVPADEVLRLAASLDQVSPHVFAATIVAAAGSRRLPLERPQDVHEYPGIGIEGTVAGHRVALGNASWLRAEKNKISDGRSAVYVSVDGVPRGALMMVDPLRKEAPEALRLLRAAGVKRTVLLSGDRRAVAEAIGQAIRADAVLWEQSAEEKIEAVGRERRHAITVMVGDGVNDAPALAAADVGVAMGARGATASSEAADAVIVVDRLDRVAEAVLIARRARHVAVQSVVAGMALSCCGMALALVGVLPPLAGAIFQEAIDVAVILNALRALTPGPSDPVRSGP